MSTNGTKTMKGRISNKHGTEEYWILSVYKSVEDQTETNKRDNPFIPLAGELIIYDPDSIYKYPRFKYGNNIDNVVDLPFVVEDTIEKAQLNLDTEEKTIAGAINEIYNAHKEDQKETNQALKEAVYLGNQQTITGEKTFESKITAKDIYLSGGLYINGEPVSAEDKEVRKKVEAIEKEVEEINKELPDFQKKIDNGLQTTDKTITGAINEVNARIFSGSYDDLTDVPTEFNPSAHYHDQYQGKEDDGLKTKNKTIVGAINEILEENIAQVQISITHENLVALRDSAKLVPGMFYRITDYICTTTQDGTRALNNKFDIVVQALSESTLSENAKADRHVTKPTILPSVIASEGLLIEGAVECPFYEITDDYGGPNFHEDYKEVDKFIGYGYGEDNNGNLVPILYKTDIDARNQGDDASFIAPDTADPFYYSGRREVDGELFDSWRKISLEDSRELGWDSIRVHYAYTNVITSEDYPKKSDIDEANFEAWELKYCLDNDTNRFTWADKKGGKGVIYYIKDEYNNEGPYDFKNIQFIRSLDQWGNFDPENGEDAWCYTFGGNQCDRSVKHSDLKEYNNNFIGSYYVGCDEAFSIPNNVFLGSSSCMTKCNRLGTNCTNNTFGDNCQSNTLGDNCEDNVFGYCCSHNFFGNNCSYNTFGTGCTNNTFDSYCQRKTFDDDTSDIGKLDNYQTKEDDALNTSSKMVVGAINEVYGSIGALETSVVNQATAGKGLTTKIEDNNLYIAIDDEITFIFDGGSTGLDVDVNEFGGVALNLGNFNETLKIEENEFGGQTAVIE